MYWILVAHPADGGSLILWVLVLAPGCFVWCGAATAPRLKLVVASVFGFAVLVYLIVNYQNALEEAGSSEFMSGFDLYIWRAVDPFIIGVVAIAWGLILWGYLRRRQAGLPSR